jgi:ankyrin repeat protein
LLKAPALESPLHVAAAGAIGTFLGSAAPKTNTPEKRLALAKLLIAKGVPVDSRFGHADLVDPRSAMVEYLDSTPLMFAAAKGDEAMVRFLLKSGADVNAKNRASKTPADFAANDSIKELLAH